MVLRRYTSPAPSPGGPGFPSQPLQAGLYGNPGIPFEQTMQLNSPFPPNGGLGPGPGYSPPQQVPFNSPFPPSNGGFAPTGAPQGTYPPHDWPVSPN